MRQRDWQAWHEDYDRPGSRLAQRLAAVREQIRAGLDASPPGPLRAISMCAGQGRDLIGVLADHPRAQDVTARLVELDPGLAADAIRSARDAGLGKVEVVTADAGLIDEYAELAPADLVLMCGVFGNITDEDIERAIGHAPQLCKTGGTVIWTRHRDPPDLVPQVCDWFRQHGFELRWLSDPADGYGVGTHRFVGAPRPFFPGARLFTFVGH